MHTAVLLLSCSQVVKRACSFILVGLLTSNGLLPFYFWRKTKPHSTGAEIFKSAKGIWTPLSIQIFQTALKKSESESFVQETKLNLDLTKKYKNTKLVNRKFDQLQCHFHFLHFTVSISTPSNPVRGKSSEIRKLVTIICVLNWCAV